eukprot:299377_1
MFQIQNLKIAIQIYNNLMRAVSQNYSSQIITNLKEDDVWFLWPTRNLQTLQVTNLTELQFLYVAFLILRRIESTMNNQIVNQVLAFIYVSKINGNIFINVPKDVLAGTIMAHIHFFEDINMNKLNQLKCVVHAHIDLLCDRILNFDLSSISPSTICIIPRLSATIITPAKRKKQIFKSRRKINFSVFDKFIIGCWSLYNEKKSFSCNIFTALVEMSKQDIFSIKSASRSRKLKKK